MITAAEFEHPRLPRHIVSHPRPQVPSNHAEHQQRNAMCHAHAHPAPPWPLSLSNSASAVIAINTRRTRTSHVPRPSLSATYRLGPSRQKQAQGCSLQVHMAGCGVGPGVVGPWLGQREVQTGPDQARWGDGVGTTYHPLTYIRRHNFFFWKGGREKTYSKSLKFCAKKFG